MNAMAPCPKDSPLMIAWEAYKATEGYANSYSWITRYIPEDDPQEIERIRQSGANAWTRQNKLQAAEGSMWASFMAGFTAAGGKIEPKTPTLDAPLHALDARGTPELLTREEKLVWILGDMMNAAENYFGVENPKRLGHINSAAIRIIDEVLPLSNGDRA